MAYVFCLFLLPMSAFADIASTTYVNTATTSRVGGMYDGCDKLDDYANIPDAWK